MPRKDDFPLEQYEISQVVAAIRGTEASVTDDGNTLIIDNDRMEVAVERPDPDDPESEIVQLVSAIADEQADLDRFLQNLSE